MVGKVVERSSGGGGPLGRIKGNECGEGTLTFRYLTIIKTVLHTSLGRVTGVTKGSS